MYFVDRSKIEQRLNYLDSMLTELKGMKYETLQQKLALERIGHVSIEAILDVGNMMIDGFIMRDPGSYEDIIDILLDENVLPNEDGDPYKQVIGLRKMLVVDYVNVNHQVVYQAFSENMVQLSQFHTNIRKYLDNELGVAHAFSNEE
ncbi:hypothetical protein OBCHQ24_12180 [Oceanobacillus iheyensis]|uniref:DUF86 domain-containing protein n=1 Tax=Oceanobacillus jordanicus TaxID=2867266 RepID=A0AAW5B4R3_9BACI|nr:DUF86 domain-containing protein [Oceanobacillus jordanicus]AVQ99732.1 hypothetical protein OBCHQ24_12180 [Oceanobacillus iheyensis]MCG3419633.1 DUF86 domain-containing protein [Oceanobacillus jordanicus]